MRTASVSASARFNVPADQMGVLRHQQAQILCRGEGARGNVKHRVLAADRVLPQELAPQIAHGRIETRALFGVHVAERIVAADDFRCEARQERRDVAAAVRHDPDFNRARMAGESCSQLCRLPVRVS
jgi:hypothetical protein